MILFCIRIIQRNSYLDSVNIVNKAMIFAFGRILSGSLAAKPRIAKELNGIRSSNAV